MPHSNTLQRDVIAPLTRRLTVTALHTRAHALGADQYSLPRICVIQYRKRATVMAPLLERGPSPPRRCPATNRHEISRIEGAQSAGPPVGRLASARREYPPEDGLRHRPEERQASAHNCAFTLNDRQYPRDSNEDFPGGQLQIQRAIAKGHGPTHQSGLRLSHRRLAGTGKSSGSR